MNGNSNGKEFDDIPIDVPEGPEFEAIPSGAYVARLISFKVEDKPQWKIEKQERQEMAKDPDKRKLPIDPRQHVWTFEITEDGWEGQKLSAWVNYSFHENSNSGKHIAALLDIPKVRPDMGLTTKALIGKPCQIFVTEYEGKNYIDKVLPAPKPRQREAMAAHKGASKTPPEEMLPGPDEF